MCVISRMYARCGPAYSHVTNRHSLNNKKNTAIDLRQGFSWSMAQSISVPQNINAPTIRMSMGVTTIYFEGDVSPPILEKYQSVPPNNRPIIL